jgi:hypothetical protein
MTCFNSGKCFAQSGDKVVDFIQEHFSSAERTLLISTLGIQPQSLFFPAEVFAKVPNLAIRCIVEKRKPDESLESIGNLHRDHLIARHGEIDLKFVDIEVIASDGATVGGRNAASKAQEWFQDKYSDIVIDATGMSRGVCFPIVQLALKAGVDMGANVHLLVASSESSCHELISESSDRAEWMHGFQQSMGLDSNAGNLKLWVPQLSERSSAQMGVMYRALSSTSSVSEVCPIVPFPSKIARRGDELLFEYEKDFYGEWDCSHLNVIYAHESNPLDVYRSIIKMVNARQEVFTATEQKATTVLSPCGWRIGSLGMLLAAIDLQLPMLYVETVGYNLQSAVPTSVQITKPDHIWHILLAGGPYDNSTL